MNRAILIDTECLIPVRGGVNDDHSRAINELSEMIKNSNTGKFPKICLCSERSREAVDIFALYIGFPHTWAVIENGAQLLDLTTGGTMDSPALLGKRAMLYAIYRRIPRLLRKYNGLYLLSGYSSCIALGRNHGSVFSIEELCKKVRRELASYVKKRKIRVSHSKETIIVAPHGISKSSGVRFWAKCCDIDIDISLAIGFSRRDVSFVKRFGIRGCPGNADNELKRHIKAKRGRVSSHLSVRGVVDVIECYKACF